MLRKDAATKGLAIVGTTLAWIPILAPVALSLASLTTQGVFRLDYLMPAELFPVALVGGGLLLWAARRAGSGLRSMAWSLGAAVLLLVGSQGLAVVTGLASGVTEPAGWRWALVQALFAGYVLSLVTLGLAGAGLLADLLRSERSPTASR